MCAHAHLCAYLEPSLASKIPHSLPAGHSSWSAAGLCFLTFWLLGQSRAFSGYTHGWRVMLSVVPALGALVVGITRITGGCTHGLGMVLCVVFRAGPWVVGITRITGGVVGPSG